MRQSNSSISVSADVVRRSIAIVAFCALAVASIMWWTSAPAHAGPYPITANAPAGDSGERGGDRVVRVAENAEPLTVKGKVLRGKLNLNTATEEQLRMLPGIGESKARRIVEFRTKRGKFKRVRDLRRVKGIGYKTLKKLSPFLAVKGKNTLTLE